MKQLENTVTGRKDFPIFDTSSNSKLLAFIKHNLDMFDLEDIDSCVVGLANNHIVIDGDKDFLDFRIIVVDVIRV